MGGTKICCGHRVVVTENLAQTTVDGWTFHVMVKASELLNMQSARECQTRHAKATSFCVSFKADSV
jgi:hypothetical protein